MSNLVIVAIPDENDRVWKVSSEKVPHLTLLFLGDVDAVQNVDTITQFVEHAATMTLQRFYLPVDRRGELGNDPETGPADVLFFKKNRYDYKAIRDFRASLLQDNNIKTAYDSSTQFDGPWQPHLTLGYAGSPAKPQPAGEDYPFYDVSFNTIAVWMGNYDGPSFLLKDFWDEYDTLDAVPMDVAMSDIRQPTVADAGAEFLAHFGVKGMRWGQRKAPPAAVSPTAMSHVPQSARRKTKITTEGGENHPASEDALKVAEAKAKLRKSGTAALSNKELLDLQNRLNLEMNVSRLVGAQGSAEKGKKFVKGLIGANKQANDAVNTGFQSQQLFKKARTA